LHGLQQRLGRRDGRPLRAAGRAVNADGGDAAVERADNQRDQPGEAVAPDRDLVAADVGARPQVTHRVTIAARLNPGIDLLARLTAARAEIAVVVEQDAEPGTAERLRIAVDRHGDGRRRAMRHDHGRIRRSPLGPIEPAAQQRTFGGKFQVAGRIAMVIFIAQRLGDDGADKEEVGGHNFLCDQPAHASGRTTLWSFSRCLVYIVTSPNILYSEIIFAMTGNPCFTCATISLNSSMLHAVLSFSIKSNGKLAGEISRGSINTTNA
jgi:hypothetical protein